MKLSAPLPRNVYDALRDLQFELHELAMDTDLEHAGRRLSRVQAQVADLIVASDLAELAERHTE